MQRTRTKKRTKRDLTSEILDPRHSNLGDLGAALVRAAKELDSERLTELAPIAPWTSPRS